jgi:GT2 family glycosyltransferase
VRLIDHVRGEEGFNFSRMANLGSWAATGDVLVFVNDDIVMLTVGWLHDVVPLALMNDVGAVGIKLLFEDQTIQHVGITLQPAHGGWPAHQNYRAPGNDAGNGGWLAFTREVLAVTGAFLAIARSTLRDIGGFATGFAINHNDVDLCLKLRVLEYRNFVVPCVSAVHPESASRAAGATDLEMAEFRARWGCGLARDPYRNPGVSWRDLQPLRD